MSWGLLRDLDPQFEKQWFMKILLDGWTETWCFIGTLWDWACFSNQIITFLSVVCSQYTVFGVCGVINHLWDCFEVWYSENRLLKVRVCVSSVSLHVLLYSPPNSYVFSLLNATTEHVTNKKIKSVIHIIPLQTSLLENCEVMFTKLLRLENVW